MHDVIKSIEHCHVARTPAATVKLSECIDKNQYSSLGNFIFVIVLITGFVVLGNIPEDKPGFVWFLPFIGAFMARAWVVEELREKAAKKVKLRVDEDNLKKSVRDAEDATRSAKRYVSSSLDEIQKLHSNLNKVETLVATANREYSQKAYAPFWDRIHDAISQLLICEKNTRQIKYYVEWYEKTLRDRNHNFPSFPISKQLVPTATTAVRDLNAVIRLGQTNFEFSSIYEQRRTREVMIEGFRSLGEAVEKYGQSVDSAFSEMLLRLPEKPYGD